jgi:signal recognition particle subunit SRP54
MDRTAAIIQSMTPAERKDPKIINASRRVRISKGSGSTVAQVNALVERFFEARKMMSAMAGRFGFPGARGNRKAVKGRKGKKGKVSGRGPTPPKMKGMPGGFPPGMAMPGMPMPGGAPQLPAGFGLDQLPPGFDPSQLKFPKK